MSKVILILLAVLSGELFGIIIGFKNMQGGYEHTSTIREIDEGETLSFEVLTIPTDATVYLDNKPIGATFSQNCFEWTPAKGQAGNYMMYFTIYPEDPNRPSYTKLVPVSVSKTNIKIIAGNPFFHMISANGGGDIEITIDELPGGAVLESNQYGPKLLTWTPSDDQVGLHTLVCRATSYFEGDKFEDVRFLKLTVTRLDYEDFKYDFNDDGVVDQIDFAMFAEHWLSGAHAVPESSIYFAYFMNYMNWNIKLKGY